MCFIFKYLTNFWSLFWRKKWTVPSQTFQVRLNSAGFIVWIQLEKSYDSELRKKKKSKNDPVMTRVVIGPSLKLRIVSCVHNRQVDGRTHWKWRWNQYENKEYNGAKKFDIKLIWYAKRTT
jgi:hypothetical protein